MVGTIPSGTMGREPSQRNLLHEQRILLSRFIGLNHHLPVLQSFIDHAVDSFPDLLRSLWYRLASAAGSFNLQPVLKLFRCYQSLKCRAFIAVLIARVPRLAACSGRFVNQPDSALYLILVLASLATGAKRLADEVLPRY